MKTLLLSLKWCNILWILLTFLSYLSPYVNPASFWGFSIFGLGYPWLLLGNILFVVLWAILKNRYSLFSLGCILLGWTYLTGFMGFSQIEKAESIDLKVMTYNVNGLRDFVRGDEPEQVRLRKELKRLFYNINVDIICLQEAPRYTTDKLKKLLPYPFIHRFPGKGTSIFSKIPFQQTGTIEFESSSNSVTWADIKIGKNTHRVFNIHFQSTQISDAANKLANEGNLQEKETWEGIGGMIRKYKHTAKIRANQSEKVLSEIAESPHPVILCGDFNETPLSYVYRQMSKGLKDSFVEKGSGFGTTYGGNIPALRIDYILVEPNITVLNHEILKVDFSDHYGVVTELKLD